MWTIDRSLAISPVKLRRLLAAAFDGSGSVKEVRILGSRYWSSAETQRVEAVLEGGRRRVFLKGREEGRAERELCAARLVSRMPGTGAPRLLAWERDRGKLWLCFEDVGEERVNLNDFRFWLLGAERLGAIHDADAASCAGVLKEMRRQGHAKALERRIGEMERLRGRLGPAAVDAGDLALFRAVAGDARLLDAAFDDAPVLLHGNYVSKNLAVVRRGRNETVRPIDWEDARLGPASFDVTELALGYFGGKRRRIVEAYEASRGKGGAPFDRQKFRRSLAAMETLHYVEEAAWAARKAEAYGDYGPEGAGQTGLLARRARTALMEFLTVYGP